MTPFLSLLNSSLPSEMDYAEYILAMNNMDVKVNPDTLAYLPHAPVAF